MNHASPSFIPICSNCKKIYSPKSPYDAERSVFAGKNIFCSRECMRQFHKFKPIYVEHICAQCGKKFTSHKTRDKRRVSDRRFCSKSCFAYYNNAHRTCGSHRSKLEIWIEAQLSNLYPTLKILYNDKSAIKAELDIYIPSLKLAFELNGIFHYEPIHGQKKLDRTIETDSKKFLLCHQNNISLCVIDTSHQRYFTEKSSHQFLEIITKIINNNIKALAN